MGSCKILRPGILTTIQDLGRKGSLYFAIPAAGAMDREAFIKGNRIVGNEDNAPAIEATLVGPKIIFKTKATIALTGAVAQWKINGKRINRNQKLKIKPKDVLEGGKFSSGMRAYVHIQGKIEVNSIFNSCSTSYGIGKGDSGLGRLTRNDRVTWTKSKRKKSLAYSDKPIKKILELFEGPEFSWLSKRSKQVLFSKEWSVSPTLNRTGSRLEGNTITLKKMLIYSVPVFAGVIQISVEGSPYLLLNDCQTMGGYPRVAYIKNKDLSTFNQWPPGYKFAFCRPGTNLT